MFTFLRGGCPPLVCVLTLTACAYRAGTFRDRDGAWPGTHATLGCIDLAIASIRDADGPIVHYAIGNRCEHRVRVDLSSARVVARDASGRETPLTPFDPRHELQALPINALWSGRENIAYRGVDPDAVASICAEIEAQLVCTP